MCALFLHPGKSPHLRDTLLAGPACQPGATCAPSPRAFFLGTHTFGGAKCYGDTVRGCLFFFWAFCECGALFCPLLCLCFLFYAPLAQGDPIAVICLSQTIDSLLPRPTLTHLMVPSFPAPIVWILSFCPITPSRLVVGDTNHLLGSCVFFAETM